jgi:HNH endonuclease
MITQELLQEKFEYSDGLLLRKTSWGGLAKGTPTGCDNGHGYLITGIKYKLYPTHRLIFLYHHGYLPTVVDHINGNRKDNRIENLREATYSQNNYNAKKKVTNKSGHKNVFWCNTRQKWTVQLSLEGKNRHIGYFDSLQLAVEAATDARNKQHKEFAKHE